jgi:hypothetical protein
MEEGGPFHAPAALPQWRRFPYSSDRRLDGVGTETTDPARGLNPVVEPAAGHFIFFRWLFYIPVFI